MPDFGTMTLTQWIGFVGMFVFAGVLIFSLVRGHRSPPGDR